MSGRPSFALRFTDPEAEAGFQVDLGKALLPIIRIGVVGGLWLWPAVALLLLLIGPVDIAGVLLITTTMFALNALTLAYLRAPRSLQRIEAIGAIVCALGGVAVILLVPVSGLPSLSVYVIPGLMVVSSYAFVVFQLPAGPGLAAAAVFLAAYLVAPLPHDSLATEIMDLTLIVTVVGLGAMAAYFLERSMRDRYRQSRLIEAQGRAIAEEQAKSDHLLRNILPARIADRLRIDPRALAEQFDGATVLFSDLVAFTPLSERLGPQATADMLNDLVSRFDDLADELGLEKIKTIGDAYLVVGGVPEPLPDHAVRVVQMGLAMIEATAACAIANDMPLALRIGVHSGPVVAGVIGRTKFAYDVWGDTVNVASRLEAAGLPGQVQVSAATIAALGDDFEVTPRGAIDLKGKGSVNAFLVRARTTARNDVPDALIRPS
ncbi:MAG: adenylate/guanylate cyclase domain-containing protein [Candidatus Limnocylindrales bacterium]